MTEEAFIETAAAEVRVAIHKVAIEVTRIISKDLDTEEGRYVKDIMKAYPTLNWLMLVLVAPQMPPRRWN